MPAAEPGCCIREQPLALAHINLPALTQRSLMESQKKRETAKEASLGSAMAFMSVGTREYLQIREGRVCEQEDKI